MYKDAYIDCSGYRYWLLRRWDESKPAVAWIMLNPSTADHTEDDPTIRRCINFAKSWDMGSIMVVNLFAARATNPKMIRLLDDPIGPRNNHFLKHMTEPCKIIVAAWGNNGTFKKRDQEVIKMFPELYCLKQSVGGNPCHPLYLKGSIKPMLFNHKDKIHEYR